MEKFGIFKQFTVKINVSIFLILTVFGVVFSLLYAYKPSIRDTLIFEAAVFGGLAAIYSAYYIGKTLKVTIDCERIHRAIEITNAIAGLEFMEIRTFIEKDLRHGEIPPAEFNERLMSNKGLLAAVKTLLNCFEFVSVAIQKNYADEHTLYLTIHSTVSAYYKVFEPYMIKRREEQPTVYTTEYEKLYNAWSSKRYLAKEKKIED